MASQVLPPEQSAPEPAPPEWLGYAAATMTWLLSAGIYIVAKWAVAEMPPWTLCFWRAVIAGVVLLPLVRGHGAAIAGLLRRRALAVLVIGGLGLGLTQGLIYVALEHTTAINAGLIISLSPIITMVLARIFLAEVLTVPQMIGALIALVGMGVIVVKGQLAALLAFSLGQGEMLMVLAALCFAVYTVALQRAAFDLPRLPLLVVLLVGATVLVLPFFLYELWSGQHSRLDTRGYLALAYVAIAGTALMYLLYNWSIEILGASKAGAFLYLQMLFVAVLAHVVLGEAIERYHLVGGGMIVVGVALVMAGAPARSAARA